MSKQQDFVTNAIAQIGKDYTTFCNWFYGSNQLVDWCAVFVSYVANSTGILNKVVTKEAGAGSFARNGVAKGWGKWYEGNETPQPGDIISFTWNGAGSYSGQDKYFSDHVGIVEKVTGTTVHTIEGNANGTPAAATVCRRQYAIGSNKNATVINGCYRPNWSMVNSTSTIPSPTTPKKADIFYKVRTTAGKWLPEVKNHDDYAGLRGYAITDVAVKVSEGSLKYRVHVLGGGWLPYVTGYNTSDFNNGYAGVGKTIDAIEIIYTPKSGKSGKTFYAVSPVNKNYYPEQINNVKGTGYDGYAGYFGVAIDRLRVIIK